MTFSNNFKNLTALIVFTCTLAGCKDGNLFKEEKSGALKEYENQSKQASFYVDSLTAVATPETVFDELGKPSVRSYNFSACIKDVSQRGVLFFQTWYLSDGVTKRTLKADQAGCIFWPEEIRFDYWGPEKFFPMVRSLEAEAGQVGRRDFTFWINPWAASVRYQAQNMVDIPVEQRAVPDGGNVTFSGKVTTYANSTLEKVRTTIPEIKLTFTGQSLKDYEVDSLLNLKVAHRYILQLTPAIRRRSINDPNKSETPTQGKFKIGFVLFKDNGGMGESFSPNDYIAKFEDVIEMDRNFGRALKESILKFPDIVGLAGRMRVVARLEYMLNNPSPFLDRPTFTGVLEGLPGSSINLTEAINPEVYDKALATARAFETFTITDSFTSFTTQKNVREILESDLTTEPPKSYGYAKEFSGPIPRSSIQKLSLGKATANDKRHLVEKMKAIISRDYKLPSAAAMASANDIYIKIVSVKDIHFVSKLNNTTPVLAFDEKADTSIPSQLSVKFSQSEAESSALTASAAVNASFGWEAPIMLPSFKAGEGSNFSTYSGLSQDFFSMLGMKPLPSVKASVNGGWSYGWNRTTTRSSVFDKSIQLTSRKRSFLIDAEVKTCKAITMDAADPTQFHDLEKLSEIKKAGPFVYTVCEKAPRRRILKESYFYIVDSVNTTDSWVDSKSFSERVFIAFIRGQGEFDVLRESWVSGATGVLFTPFYPFEKSSNGIPASILQRVTQKYPGVASGFPAYEERLLKQPKLDYGLYDSLYKTP